MKKRANSRSVRFSLLLVLGIVVLAACENPYIVHNLFRAVTMTAIDFYSDKEETPYALKPVFNKSVTEYEVWVHPLSEKVYPNAVPEEGASVIFGNASYTLDAVDKSDPPQYEGAREYYAFPPSVPELNVTFTVYKEHRIDGVYTATIRRRPDPGRLQQLKITVGYHEAPDWIYEQDNHLANFAPTGNNYTVKLPYYTERVVVEPYSASSNIVYGYTLYAENPLYYPESRIGDRVDFDTSDNPQIFDFTGNGTPGFDIPTKIFMSPPASPDSISGLKTAYLKVHTVSRQDNIDLYPQDYNIKLEWEKSLAYLKELHVTNDSSPSERLSGNFYPMNNRYDAEVPADAAKITVKALVRDSSSAIEFRMWPSQNYIDENYPAGFNPGNSVDSETNEFTLPPPGPETVSCIVELYVTNTDPNVGPLSYWIEVRREQPLASLKNIELFGKLYGDDDALPPQKALFKYNNTNVYTSPGPDQKDSTWSTLKDALPLRGTPPYPAPYASDPADSVSSFRLEYTTNFIVELDGINIKELMLVGTAPDSGGTITYNVDDNALWPPSDNVFAFNGGVGATITVSQPGHKDRVYAFTFIRAGAQVVEMFTDKRVPVLSSPPYTGMPNAAPDSTERKNHDSERGTFQAIVNNRAVNSVMPDQKVTLRASPKLGWKVSKLYLLNDDGTAVGDWASLTASDLTGMDGPAATVTGATEWEFKMPNRKLNFLLQYEFVTNPVSRVAYVAPVGKASRGGVYDAVDGTGTAWAYATSNLQGVINEFDGGAFDEIWIAEGTYRLDAGDWAEEITDRNEEINRAFVLKPGLRMYGGFTGVENLRGHPRRGTDAAKTILSGSLSGSKNARHVVIAADILSPAGDNPISRSDLSQSAGYDFTPDFDASGVTLLDTLRIRDGMRTKDDSAITVRGKPIVKRNGAGLYCVDASPYLRNVIISDNTGVNGGGVYNTGGYPVFKNAYFSNNDATGYNDQGGDGGGFYNADGRPVFLDSQFANNATIGGDGAGIFTAGGKVLVRRTEFRFNNASSGGGLANGGETWVYDSVFRNNAAVGTGSHINNNGTLYLVNVTAKDSSGTAVSSGGTLSGTNLTVRNSGGGLTSSGSLALVNSRFTANGTGVSVSGSAALNNVVIDNNSGTGFSYGMSQGAKNGSLLNNPALYGCILTNVTISNNGTGVNAFYSSSQDFHTGAASLLLNSVRISDNTTGMSVSYGGSFRDEEDGTMLQGGQFPESKKGIHVTLNNVTITGNTTGLTTNANDLATALTKVNTKGEPYVEYDVLDLRIRNSVILGNNTTDTALTERRIIGVMGNLVQASPPVAITPGSNTLTLPPGKANLVTVGDSFRITSGAGAETPFRVPVNLITAKNGNEITFTTTAANNAAFSQTGDYMVLLDYMSLGRIGTAAWPSMSPNELTLSPAQTARLPVDAMFRIRTGTSGPFKGSVYRVTSSNPQTGKVAFTPSVPGGFTPGTDTLWVSSERAGRGNLGARFKPGAGANTWILSAAQKALIMAALDAAGGSDISFKTASGERLNAASYTVASGGVSGNTLTFTAPAANPYAADDRIVLENGTVGAAGSFTMGTNTLSVTDAQAELLLVVPGTQFRIVTPSGVIRPSINTVTGVSGSPGAKVVSFTVTRAGPYVAADSLVIDTGEIKAGYGGNYGNGGGSLVSGSNTLILPLPGQAALFTGGDTFYIASANGTLKAGECTVTSVIGDSITFDASAGIPYIPGDSFVLPPVKYPRLPGAVAWLKSRVGGAEQAVIASVPAYGSSVSWGALLPGGGLDGTFRPTGGLVNSGDTSAYPAAATVVDMLFAGVDDPAGYPGKSGSIKTAIEGLLGGSGKLYTWSGTTWPSGDPNPANPGSWPPTGGVLVQKTIADFLSRDNGSNRGDTRTVYAVSDDPDNARNNGSDAGAYEN
jgi:hypothetical protein